MTGWHFRQKLPGEKERNPVSGEYFDEVSIERPAQALVREVIQNSLDANADGAGEAVHVRFYLSGVAGALSAERASAWLGKAWQHITAPESGLRGLPSQPDMCPYLLVEDFGTKGLEGDTAAEDLQPGDEKNHFYAFFRAEGVSESTGGRGTWGVGKTVFARSSRINTFFGLTVRRPDALPHLMGQAILRFHRLNETKFAPDGMFGVIQSSRQFVYPVQNQETIEQFRRDFRINRQDEAGLSVIVPYCLEEITEDMIVQAVGREYFFPILAGRLTVSVDGPNSSRTLDTEHLLGLIDSDETDLDGDLKSLICFAIDAQTLPESEITQLSRQEGAPSWDPPPIPDGAITALAPRFMHGELLGFRVPVAARIVAGEESLSHFDMFLRKDMQGAGYPPCFIRNGIIIPKALSRRVRGQRLFALVIISHESLVEFLGNAENPAHTQWSHNSQNFREKYEDGRVTLEFIRSAPRRIAEILSRAQDERDWVALADFFPQPPEDNGIPERDVRSDGDDGDEPEPPPPSVKVTPQPFRIDHMAGGFRVVRDNPERIQLPTALQINIAYDTSRGDPLRRYHRQDFNVARGPIRVAVATAQVRKSNDNRLLVQLDGDDFRIEVTGFDDNRDLYVKVNLATDEAGESKDDEELPGLEEIAT